MVSALASAAQIQARSVGSGTGIPSGSPNEPATLADDEHVSGDHHQRRPAVLSHVPCGDKAERGEQAVLGHRVRDEGKLGLGVERTLNQVAGCKPDEQERQQPQDQLDPAFLSGERTPLHGGD